MIQTFITDGLPKRFQFVLNPFGNHLNPAIGQVSDRAGDFKAGGYRFYGIPKAYTLNSTRIDDLHSFAHHCIT